RSLLMTVTICRLRLMPQTTATRLCYKLAPPLWDRSSCPTRGREVTATPATSPFVLRMSRVLQKRGTAFDRHKLARCQRLFLLRNKQQSPPQRRPTIIALLELNLLWKRTLATSIT